MVAGPNVNDLVPARRTDSSRAELSDRAIHLHPLLVAQPLMRAGSSAVRSPSVESVAYPNQSGKCGRETTVDLITNAVQYLLGPRSPACCWRHKFENGAATLLTRPTSGAATSAVCYSIERALAVEREIF